MFEAGAVDRVGSRGCRARVGPMCCVTPLLLTSLGEPGPHSRHILVGSRCWAGTGERPKSVQTHQPWAGKARARCQQVPLHLPDWALSRAGVGLFTLLSSWLQSILELCYFSTRVHAD